MSDVPVGQAGLLEAAPAVGLSPFKASWRRFSRNKLAVGSLTILALIIVACYGGPWLFPYGPEDADFENISAPVNLFSLHPFGTDEFGRDLFSRVVYGSRISLLAGGGAVLLGALAGVTLGMLAGYFRGPTETVLARLFDTEEFLGDFGVRSLSRWHRNHPYSFRWGGSESWVYYLPAASLQPRQSADFILSHETAVANHVSGKYCGKSSLHAVA